MQQITHLVTGMLMLAAILIAWQGTARADLLQIEDGIELRTSDVFWDGLRTGRLTLRRCASCKPRVVRVDAATRYSIEGIGSFDDAREFLAQLDAIGRRDGITGIFVARGTDRVRRIILAPSAGN